MDLYARGLAAQLKRAQARQAAPRAVKPVELERYVSPEQLAAITDPARERAFAAGRRGGKTRSFCWCLILAALERPRSNAVYLSTSINRAVDTLWEELTEVLRDAGIPFKPNGQARTFTFENGSRIWVSGVENKKQANKIRGRIRRTALVCIDEAQDWASELLRYTYQVVLWPTMADIGGRTILGGTGTGPRGFWYEHTRKPDVSVHRWTLFENTRGVHDAAATLTKAITDKGIEVVDLTEVRASQGVGLDPQNEIAQEYFCQFVAGAKQIFTVSAERNTFTELPVGPWHYVIGVDWGTVDKAAVVVWGWTPASPRLHLIAYEAKAGLGTVEQMALAMKYVKAYPPLALVADPATGGNAHILDLQDRYGVPAEAAEKDGKVSAVVLMRDALRRGDIVLPAGEFPRGEFVTALETPEWDLEQVQKSLKGHMPDLCDAALYAFRKARHFDYTDPVPAKSEEERVLEQMREQHRERERFMEELFG